MQRLKGRWNQLPQIQGPCAVTLGNFDGMHLGHQALIHSVRAKAQSEKMQSLVVLFEPQPLEYFQKQKVPIRLQSLSEKILFLSQQNIDAVLCMHFDATLSQIEPLTFVSEFLIQHLNAKSVHIGQDFRFGKQRQGDFSLLQEYGKRTKAFDVWNVPEVLCEGERISSTGIRHLLHEGQLEEVTRRLGRRYSKAGRVSRGAGRGSTLGIPTANLYLSNPLPVQGVFAVHTEFEGEWYPSVANVGTRPTVDGSQSWLEIHILDQSLQLYGKNIRVDFCHKIREERRFESVPALVAQIQQDVEEARGFFNL